jgi:sec-independent protein translocase protein TatA
MMGIGPMELIVVLVIALIVLGPKRLPEAGRSLGKGLREFKDSVNNLDPREEIEADLTPASKTSRKTAENAFGDEAP